MKRYSRYIAYIKPKLWYLAGALLAGLLFGASSGFGMPVIFDKVLKRIFMPEDGVAYSLWYVFGVAMLIPFVFIVRAITGYLSGYLMSYVSLDVLRRIKQDLFSRVQDYRFSTSTLRATSLCVLQPTLRRCRRFCFRSPPK